MAALIPTACIFLFFNLFLTASFAFVPSFINYPPAVIPCLTDAAVTSGCNADSITFLQNNACLCGNGGGYLTLAAQCIQANAPNDLQDTYTTSVGNCDTSDTPMTLSWAQFLAAAQGGTSTSVQQSPIATSSLNPSTTIGGSGVNSNGGGGSGGGGLSKSDIIALAVGIPATVFTIIGVFIMCCK